MFLPTHALLLHFQAILSLRPKSIFNLVFCNVVSNTALCTVTTTTVISTDTTFAAPEDEGRKKLITLCVYHSENCERASAQLTSSASEAVSA